MLLQLKYVLIYILNLNKQEEGVLHMGPGTFTLLLVILLISTNLYSHKKAKEGRQRYISEKMKENNNQIIKVEKIFPFSPEKIPFSRVNIGFRKKGITVYKVNYKNKNDERKIIYVKFDGYSINGEWREL